MKKQQPIWWTAIIKIATCCWLLVAQTATAHEPSKSYLSLTLDAGVFAGRLDIPLRDLKNVTTFDSDKNSIVSPAHFKESAGYAFSHLQILCDGRVAALQLTSTNPAVEELSDGAYLQLDFVLQNISAPQTIQINYQLFFETNSLHRGLLRLEADGKVQAAAFSPAHPAQEFQLAAPVPSRQFFVFLREGVCHIWTGYDHILFLLALLLPSVLRREAGRWQEVEKLRPAFYNVLKIVTAFTLAHSLTLSLAALDVIKLPSRLTESAIALSVGLAAANNLWPLVRERGWMVAFFFGLIHGFGFATALADFGLTQGALWITLVGFNLGVEIGQLAIVACFLPLAYILRRTWFYQVPLLQLGSASIILLAAGWFAERVLDVKFMPF